jgi:hypothetical protein
VNNKDMTTNAKTIGPIPADILTDGEAVLEAVMAGKKSDPEIARRVRERAEKVTAELRRKYGTLNVAVDAIRSLRDQ